MLQVPTARYSEPMAAVPKVRAGSAARPSRSSRVQTQSAESDSDSIRVRVLGLPGAPPSARRLQGGRVCLDVL